jgi:hypothetical protein
LRLAVSSLGFLFFSGEAVAIGGLSRTADEASSEAAASSGLPWQNKKLPALVRPYSICCGRCENPAIAQHPLASSLSTSCSVGGEVFLARKSDSDFRGNTKFFGSLVSLLLVYIKVGRGNGRERERG